MNITVWSHLIYLAISVAITIWVGHTLHKHGRLFLVDSFFGNEALADSINHLLLVGFYLVNIGFVVLALKNGARPDDAVSLVEGLSTKIGTVLLVLGAMHFGNICVFSRMRKRALLHSAPPPLPPDARIPVIK